VTTCPLCLIYNQDARYFKDGTVVITDCPYPECGMPIVIFARHVACADLPVEWLTHAEAKLKEVFGDGVIFMTSDRHAKAHHHWHVVMEGGQ